MTESGERLVGVNDAREEWASAAAEVLTETAAHYGAVVKYADLAEQVQLRTRLRSRSHSRNWIGLVLAVVVARCRAQGLPPLTSLVAHRADGGEPDEGTVRARLACYMRFADDVPADVIAEAAATAAEKVAVEHAVRAPRAQPRRRADRPPRTPTREEAPPKICPTCFVQLPASGRCDNCD